MITKTDVQYWLDNYAPIPRFKDDLLKEIAWHASLDRVADGYDYEAMTDVRDIAKYLDAIMGNGERFPLYLNKDYDHVMMAVMKWYLDDHKNDIRAGAYSMAGYFRTAIEEMQS